MARLRRSNLRVGAAIRIPVDEHHYGLALTVARIEPSLWYLAGYPNTFETGAQVDLVEATRGTPLALTLTMDVLIRHGDWDVIGDAPVDHSAVLLPAYKTTIGAPTMQVVVCDYTGKIRRPATAEEETSLPNRIDHPPVLLEEVIRSRHSGRPPGRDHLDLAPVPWERSSQALFGIPA